MNKFEYVNAKHLADLPELLGPRWGESAILAGGTDLLDMLKERLIEPKRVVNIKNIKDLYGISNGNGIEIGALTTIATIAADPKIQGKYAVLSEAAASVATPQLRNMGTIGGNICQRPRCWYFRGKEFPCLKKGGSKCYSVEGLNQYNAILGGGPSFIVHPSDSAPALMALEASIEILGASGTQETAIADFFQLPVDNLRRENILKANQVVTKIMIPEPARGTRSTYLKFREKQSMDFAISSVAAVLQMSGNRVQKARIVLGGVASIPWRVKNSEAELEGKTLNAANIENAASVSVANALPLQHNGYKIQLTENLVRRALQSLS